MADRRWMFALAGVGLIWLFLAGCAPTAVGPEGAHASVGDPAPLEFTTIIEGAASGGSGTMPSLVVARTDRRLTALLDRLSSQDRPLVERVNLSRDVVLAVFLGLRPTSGYGIEVRAVTITADLLAVVVKRESPEPGEPVRQGFETPYAVVRVSREEFLAYRPSSYRLRDASGEILAEGRINSGR